jgi:hypothetical protein
MTKDISYNVDKTNNGTTYFINVPKDFSNIEDIMNKIKNEYGIEEIDMNDIKCIKKSDLIKQNNIKQIKTYKTKEIRQCDYCNKEIKFNKLCKKLICNHVYHIKCLKKVLNENIYMNCNKCNTENISCYL